MSHKSFSRLVSSQTIQLAIACIAGGIFVPAEAARENPACHISHEFWMPPTFVTLFGTIWLPSYEELCNMKLTWKRARPSITIKSQTKQLFAESFSGSRQDILKLLQTWETKSVIKRSFSRSKKLYASKEVKEFPKMGQILPETGNQCWNAQETHRPYDLWIGKNNICSVKKKNPQQHTPSVFLSFKFKWWSTLLMLSSDGSVCTTWQWALLSDALLLYGQFPVVKRD